MVWGVVGDMPGGGGVMYTTSDGLCGVRLYHEVRVTFRVRVRVKIRIRVRVRTLAMCGVWVYCGSDAAPDSRILIYLLTRSISLSPRQPNPNPM